MTCMVLPPGAGGGGAGAIAGIAWPTASCIGGCGGAICGCCIICCCIICCCCICPGATATGAGAGSATGWLAPHPPPLPPPLPMAANAGTHAAAARKTAPVRTKFRPHFVEPKRCICVIFPLTFTTSHFGQTLVQHPSALGALASTTPPRRIAVSPVRRSLPMAALLRAQRLLVGAAAPTAGAFRRPAAALSRRLCQQRWAGRAASSLSLHVEYCEK